uniref:Uncharacterized protein n=1 Tax=uncultured Armatimonadetes bacterium TaxID=157466 RepID=A0A6J4IDB4_9BACT|nr:hypothetical protein AVDCRST_MAG63-1727 [uncultured Armatimonadetes bacterium]
MAHQIVRHDFPVPSSILAGGPRPIRRRPLTRAGRERRAGSSARAKVVPAAALWSTSAWNAVMGVRAL